MAVSPAWHPLVPSSAAHRAYPLAARAVGHALVAWRTDAGVVQVWEDRCPHRGVRLSLGRITHDRLACAYHGWEYAAGSGRCVAIPAMPDIPVPGRVCTRTYPARDSQGMVWVQLDASDTLSVPPEPFPSHGLAPPHFCQSLAIAHAHPETLLPALGQHGHLAPPQRWHGHLAGHPVHAFVLQADDRWSMLHLWCTERPSADGLRAVMAAARRLRADIEATLA